LVALFSCSAAYEAFTLSALTPPDVWVHLRTGVWMMHSHAIPRTALFSQYEQMRWNDSTWGFDLILGLGYSLFGLRAMPILLIALKVAVGITIFSLARVGRLSFWSAVLVGTVGQYVVPVRLLPYAFSILCFASELALLVRSRQTGSAKGLFWLPGLFAIWANLHVQFVVGLVLLALFVIAGGIEAALRGFSDAWFSKRIAPLGMKHAGVVLGASILATLLNPYGYKLVPAAIHALYSPVGLEHFAEMSSMTFRRPQDFLLMMLVMMAFLALGRRRSVEMFELMALIAGTVAAFRIERDGWMAMLPAVAVIAGGFSDEHLENRTRNRIFFSRESRIAAAISVIVAVVCSLLFIPSPNALMLRAGKSFPVKACDFIRENKLPSPMFNAYSWGGFAAWYLREYPVVVDSRAELYGDRILDKYFDIVGGKELLESEPMVSHAGTLLLEKDSAMTKALTNLLALRSKYRLVYSDEIASVFVQQPDTNH